MGEVHIVKAGYARNFLIPSKKAVYAIPKNFKRRGLVDLVVSTSKKSSEEETADIRAADFLRTYLQSKTLKLWRNVDKSFVDTSKNNIGLSIYPGTVTANHVKEKLKKQLKIELQENESVHLSYSPVSHANITNNKEMKRMLDNNSFEKESVEYEVRNLGEYLVKILLKGNQSVGLKLSVLKR